MAIRTPVRAAAVAAAVTFLLLGVLGLVPGITTHYADLRLAGHGSHATLLGLFQVSILHDLVHLLFGLAGLALARTSDGAATFLAAGGVLALVLWLLGVVDGGSWLPVNTADNWLHFALGLGMIAVGAATTRERRRPATA
jgi:hypothetical protein